MTQLELKNISKSFNGINLFNDVNFVLKKGERACLFGASGSGKSSLLQISAGILKQDYGEVFIMSEALKDEESVVNARRNHIAFIFQFHNLIPELTVYENITIAQEICNKKDIKFTDYLLQELGLFTKRNQKPQTLSGGEAQRVAVVRAFATKPKIIFADEPTGSLDPQTGEKTIELILNTAKNLETSLLAVSHNNSFKSKFDIICEINNCNFKSYNTF